MCHVWQVREITKFGHITAREQELRAREKRATVEQKRACAPPKVVAELERVAEAKVEVLKKLDDFREEPDEATGHAFVVFLYERQRNELIKRCRIRSMQWMLSRWLPCCFGDPRPTWESAGGGRPMVDVAPGAWAIAAPCVHRRARVPSLRGPFAAGHAHICG